MRGVRGFALVAAIFAIVVIAAIVTGGFFISTQSYRVGTRSQTVAAGLYSAEAGLGAALARWDPAVTEELAPGSTITLLSEALPTGDRYRVWVTRLDGGQDERVSYYAIRSIGRVAGGGGGRRRLTLLVRSHRPRLCCDAALQARGPVNVTGSSTITGVDVIPDAWSGLGLCTEAADRPGVLTEEESLIRVAGDGTILGEPRIRSGPLTEEDFFVYGDLTYDDVASRAELSYPHGTLLTELRPTATAGACARGTPTNWGAPRDPTHACFHYYPIIHARGDLTLRSRSAGQGILLVDGDLRIEGGFAFYGPAIVRGRVEVAGTESRIYGGVQAYNAALRTHTIAGDADIGYSSCAATRAVTYSTLAAPRPLAQRAWMELLD